MSCLLLEIYFTLYVISWTIIIIITVAPTLC